MICGLLFLVKDPENRIFIR